MKNNVWLYDLESTGVWIDGNKVDKRAFLLGSHVIEFGSHTVLVKTSDDILI